MRYLQGEELLEAEKRMHEAAGVAKDAKCLRALCGTVIVKDGQIIGRGFNALPGGETPTCCMKRERPAGFKSDATCCIHAEQRAIMDALAHFPDKVAGSTLYFTRVSEDWTLLRSGQPYCTICSKMALDAGVGHFLLRHENGICSYETPEYNELSFQYGK